MKPIIAAPSADPDVVKLLMGDVASELFRGVMFDALWAAGVHYGIDPVGMVAQSAIETNWGTFKRSDGQPGAVSAGFFNTCGLKVRNPELVRQILLERHGITTPNTDHPLCHQMFPDWLSGAVAQAQHLRAYCGLAFTDPRLDPRFVWVWGKHECRHWVDLSGKWAGPNYGTSIEAVMDRLTGV